MPDPQKIRETLDASELSASDCRSALVLVEPIFGPGYVAWHGMAFAGGKVVNDITGSDRMVVLDDCLCALAAAGIVVDVEDARK